MTAPDWSDLGSRYPAAWVQVLEQADRNAASLSLTPATLAARDIAMEDRARLRDVGAQAAARELLDGLAAIGWMTVDEVLFCPVCKFEPVADGGDGVCPNPEADSHAFTDGGAPSPAARRTYTRQGTPRRHIGWLLALHGMNTRGSWQESFNWLVSTSYGRMVPVAIYKYGMVRPGVLSRRRHATLAGRVAERLRRASEEASRIVEDPRPDVIAHSFGTLLVGKALHSDPDLRVGRIVTLGCILRPDFDWATLVGRGQVEAVLNNYGTRDFWANLAHQAIPDTGPAGRRGFDYHPERWPEDQRHGGGRRVFNVPAQGFTHSQFFEDEPTAGRDLTTLASQFVHVWQPFLTTRDLADVAAALERQGSPAVWPEESWRQRPWPLRRGRGAVRFIYPA